MFTKSRIAVLYAAIFVYSFCNVYASDQIRAQTKCSEIDQLIKISKIAPKVLCYKVKAGENTGLWVKTKECPADADFYKKASVYASKKHVIKIFTESYSASRDWTERRTYYFAGKNILFFELVEFVTFNAYDTENDKTMDAGPYTIKERNYYDVNGYFVSSTVEAVDKNKKKVQAKYIQKPRPMDPDEIDNIISSL
jgi:hypothetical protein